MQLTALQKSAAQAIVNIFETGSIRGDYGDVTLLPGDSGQLTYGRSQTTLASGNLFLLIQDYCNRNDGEFSTQFKPYLPKLEACDTSLNQDMTFRGLLEDAGDDPVMQDVQDVFFDRVYWDPAMASADAIGAQSALGAAIVYDSTVHGSWALVRDMTRKQFGELKQIGEVQWMTDYVETRRNWLATYPNPLLHKTVYRMDAFQAIIGSGNWKLALPITVRGLSITADALTEPAPVKVPAEPLPRRLLSLKSPPLTGADVSWLQGRLTQAGVKVADSGSFDAATDAAVRAFQAGHNLKVDGVVGPATRAALEDIPVIAPKTAQTAAATEPMPAVPQPKPATPVAPPPAAGAVAQTGGDAVAEIKSHVSSEVKSGVATLQKSISDSNAQIKAIVAPKQPAKAAAKPAKAPTAEAIQTALSTVSLSSRPVLAAASSAFILLFTEIRDAVAWVAAGLESATTAGTGIKLPPLPAAVPHSLAEAMQFLTAIYNYVCAFAASLPNEWMFRIRILAILLIIYALYRVRRAHITLSKIQQGIAAAQTDVANVEQDVSGVQQDVATAKQIVQDVKDVARIVK